MMGAKSMKTCRRKLHLLLAVVALAAPAWSGEDPPTNVLTIPLVSQVEWDEGVQYNSVTPRTLEKEKHHGLLQARLPEDWVVGEPFERKVDSFTMGPSPFEESATYLVPTVVSEKGETLEIYIIQGDGSQAIHDIVRTGLGFGLAPKNKAVLTETWKFKTESGRSRGVLKVYSDDDGLTVRAAVNLKLLTVLMSGPTSSPDRAPTVLEFAKTFHVVKDSP
ncbi:MAG: hypothetical protein GY722_06220 [bacterium]|nr:hypothetical protein [bacterium]